MAGGLSATPLGPSAGFNWIYLVELLVCGILGLFFLFYFNRLFATVISYAIRAWTWHKYRAYIDITALQFSLLGGRIFFKGVKYHAHNVTVLVHDGHITWRYWLGAVQEAEVFNDENEVTDEKSQRSGSTSRSERSKKDDEKSGGRSRSIGKAENAGSKKKELPCRISVKVAAVEAFIYNRSPVYDMIVDATLKKARSSPNETGSGERKFEDPTSPSSSSQEDEKVKAHFGVAPEKTETHNTNDSINTRNYEKPEVPSWLRILPVKVECKRAAAAVGNENTTSIVTAKLERAVGSIDAGQAGPLDIFKLLFNFDFEQVNVALKPNRDFKQLQLDAAKRVLREKETEVPRRKELRFKLMRYLTRRWHQVTHLFRRRMHTHGSVRTVSTTTIAERAATPRQDQIPGESDWHGLTRYLNDTEHDEHAQWEQVEYAKSSTLVECPKISFRFYWDIPGKVPSGLTDSETLLGSPGDDDINGSKPPDYGLDFGVHGGTVVYGPWADRQRQNLQQIFFPGSYVDAVAEKPLKPGDTRAITVFKIYVSVDEDVTLRIPTREPSKDDQWYGRADPTHLTQDQGADEPQQKGKHRRRRRHHKRRKGKQGQPGVDARPYGWLDITVKKDTTVNYTQDMFARADGFRNSLNLDVKGTEMTSSVNHGLLWRAGPLTLVADLSYPIGWNTLRRWPFKIVCDDLELFILRDHMFLIIDIVNDWSSGPPPEFYTFVPFFYDLDMTFRNFVMYMNVNDANIINDPADLDKNDFLTLEGRDLRGVLGIPLEHYRPKRNELTFDVLAQDMRMRMLSPPRNTLHTLIKEKQVAVLPKLTLKGSFDQHGETQPGLTDVLRFDIVGTGLDLMAHGQLVRQLINIKENYFGDYLHFKTLEEFQHASEDLHEANAKTASVPHPQDQNEMDVILCIVAEDATVMFPTNIYSGEEYVRAELPVANLDLRITSYYLDMGLNLSPLSFLAGSASVGDEESPVESASSTQIYVSHVDLYGHRMFGLPPKEFSYVNTWDIDVGTLTGECSGAFLHDLALVARTFVFAFQDGENALPVVSPNVFSDITFVQVRTDIVRLWFHVGKDALLLSAEPISVDTSDWASDRLSQRVTVLAPLVTIACVDGRSASRHRMKEHRRQPVRTYAFFQTGAAVDVVIRNMHFATKTAEQQAHLVQSDRRTGRAPFLRRGEQHPSRLYREEEAVEPPAMPYPPLPYPLSRSGQPTGRPLSIKSVASFVSGTKLRKKSSSASIAVSVQGSNARLGIPTFRSIRQHSTDQISVSSGHSHSSDSSDLRVRGLQSDRDRAKFGLPRSTMAFSSSYTEPYFPLEDVEPDETDVPPFSVVANDENDGGSETSSIFDQIEDPNAAQDAKHVTVLIKLGPGIRAYAEPRLGIIAGKVLSKLLPKSPQEVMDGFQLDVMNSIAARQQGRHGDNDILEIQASLPSAKIRIVNREDDQAGDEVDVSIDSLEQMVRVRTRPSPAGAKQSLALHTKADALAMTLRDRASTDTPAVKANVDDILVWVALADTQSIHVSVRDTGAVIAGQQAEYLVLLALRIMPVVAEIQSRIEAPLESNRRKLLYLMYTLTQHGETVGDPPYLSRMTYILRAFADHSRNQDSWKVLARFRYMLHQLPNNVSEELVARYKADDIVCPADASTKVLESWAQWRNWDIPNVTQTLVFRMLYSQAEAKPMEEPEEKPLTMTVRSEYLRIALDAQSKTSEVIIQETSLGLDSTPPSMPTGLMLVEENKRKNTLLQMHTSSIGLSFDWALFSVVEVVLPLKDRLEKLATPPAGAQHRSATRVLEENLDRHDFHVAFSTDEGTIALQSINIRHDSRAEGLKMSLIGSTQANESYGQAVCAMVNVERMGSELHSGSSRIWHMLLTSPSLYIHHLQPLAGVDEPPLIMLAAAYNELELVVQEQLPGILHIADAIILDEVAKIMHLVDATTNIEHSPGKPEPESEPLVPPQTAKLNIALLAGQLQLEISLLQALNYRLDGDSFSIRVAPSLLGDTVVDIDYDVGRQSHSLVNLSRNERHHQGLLDLPPINGHVGIRGTSTDMWISVATTVEKVEVDAAAIQGIVAVVNRPEVQDGFTAVKDSIDDMKQHAASLPMQHREDEKASTQPTKRTFFDIRFALLGIRVAASTPRSQKGSTAEVEFGIGPVHVLASNMANTSDVNQLIPEVRAQIQDIGARLWIDNGGQHQPCGNVTLGLKMHFRSDTDRKGSVARILDVTSSALDVNVYPETALTIVDVINHLQDRLHDLDLSKEIDYLRRLHDSRRQAVIEKISGKDLPQDDEAAFSAADLLAVKTTVALTNIQISWLVDQRFAAKNTPHPKDAVLTLASVEFTTHGGHEARLSIKDVLLQLTQSHTAKKHRALNSALLPEVGFSVAYWVDGKDRSLAFKATGKPLDLRLESTFIVHVNAVQKSAEYAIESFKTGTATWQSTPTATGAPRQKVFDAKKVAALLVEADFAGAQVYMQGAGSRNKTLGALAASSQEHSAQHGRYGQFASDGEMMHSTLRAPGIALKFEYNSNDERPTINAELRIDASSNMLLPNVVPLMLEVSNSVKEVIQNNEDGAATKQKSTPDLKPSQPFFEENAIVAANPTNLFGKTKVDFGLRICRQEFGLSCQPIARVDAKAALDDFYFTVNTIESEDYGHFFAMSAVMSKISASVKHVYSREPTFSYEMDSIVLSLMNSKHLSGVNGVSAILKLNPTKLSINGKQLQDLLIFREIWLPPEIRHQQSPQTSSTSNAPSTRPEDFVVQKYQSVAAAAAFPWNATVSIAKLEVDLDLGQSIGKTSFSIKDLWASQQKSSSWEQNLCIGLEQMAMVSSGRMSGFIELAGLGVRTSIKWPQDTKKEGKTPLIQASLGFSRLRAKAAFDYQAFAFGDIEGFDFLMYNVRQPDVGSDDRDRLVAVLDCEKAYIFCTSTSPAQAVGLYQAFDRLVQEKQAAYTQSLKDIEKHLRRESVMVPTRSGPSPVGVPLNTRSESKKLSISLHTDVVLTLGTISFGVYPSTFFDSQLVKLEANNIQARFAVGLERGRIHSGLGMTLGQLQVALPSVKRVTAVPKALEVSVDEVITSATQAKGGTILRVPKVIASMQTWQAPDSNVVDYIFRSLFEGKIDVGWNLSRINFIKGMWTTHSRSLASRLGKPLPESAVKIKAGPDDSEQKEGAKKDNQEKITAEVNLPQSKYEYRALEPVVIETPQLRDMGEATPPLEWVGLQRDKLPNVTHQIIIVSLLEVAKEVEDAYERILGSS